MSRKYAGLIIFSVLPLLLNAQTGHPANRKIVVQDVTVTGIRTIGTSELNEITRPLSGSVINDDPDEIRERLRYSFQNHGYFEAKVKSMKMRTNDPLAAPRPVSLEFEVVEGILFRIGEITFTGNHALSSEELHRVLPVQVNEPFNRYKLGSGFEAIRNAYVKLGYIDFFLVPGDHKGSATTVDLKIRVEEGQQFKMGALEISGNKTPTELLRSRWELERGQPFDASYLDKFLEDNRSLLPSAFVSNDAKIIRNCREVTVTVFIDLDPEHRSAVPSEIGCGKGAEASAN